MNRLSLHKILGIVMLVGLLVAVAAPSKVLAQITPLPTPDPKPGGYGLQATKTQAAPTEGASITVPGNGASFTESPITVQGICPDGLLVQIYNNNVMVGAVICENGSFSVQVSLFIGTNDLKAVVFDDVEQAGPESNTVTVTYTNSNFTAFGQLITLTSTYGRRAAAAGTQLGWPIQLSGGNGPYAFSIDWGDGSDPELMSQAVAGAINIGHVYKNAGIYQINIRVSDVNGVTAFLQLVAVANGEPKAAAGTTETNGKGTEKVAVLWIPAAIAFFLLFPTFWLGRRSQIVSLRNRMLKERDAYGDK